MVAESATFLLVHGSWHAGDCWDLVADRLRATGHRVLAPDLPGRREVPMPANGQPTVDAVASLVGIVDGEAEPVVLVGHSSGGMLVSEVARQRPGRVAAAVYLAAFHLPPGRLPRDAIRPEDGSRLGAAIQVEPCSGRTTIRPEQATDLFYHDCAPELAAAAVARLVPEPSVRAGSGAPQSVDDSDVPCATILTLDDRALPIVSQRRMAAALPCALTYEMATGHSPFLSAPDALAGILREIAASAASLAPAGQARGN